jgi:4-amino-4-deoxy-L-arabinose transferase-like glycosyltransferase
VTERVSDEADVDTKQAAAVSGVAARSPDELRKDILAASGIFLFAFALYLLPAVMGRPLTETPEARVAVVAREMIQNKNYILPTIGGEPRLNKPPLPYWLAASSAQILTGKDGLTTRVMNNATLLPSALAGAGALFLVVLYGCTVFGRAAGVISGLVLGLSMLVTRFAQLGYGDMTLMFCCTWMFVSAAWIVTMPRPGFVSALELGLAIGLGILTKGHIPVLLLLGPLVVEMLIRRRFNGRKVALFAVALVIASASLWWFFEVKKLAPGAWDTMSNEANEGLINPHGHLQSDRYIYYLYQILGALLPWTPLLVVAWALYLFRDRKGESAEASGIVIAARENVRFFVITFIVGFIGLYIASKQQPYYLLPILPPLALASGYVLSQFRFPGGMQEEKLAWAHLAIGVIAGLAVITMPLWVGQLGGAGADSSKASFKAFVASSGFAVTAPLGLAVIALHFFCARQWVEGRPLASCGVFALVSYLGLGLLSAHWAKTAQRSMTLASDAPQLRARLDGYGRDMHFYGIGAPESLYVFYLERPVHSLEDLSREAAGKTGDSAPQRALILRHSDLPHAEKEWGLSVAEDIKSGKDAFEVLMLPNTRDWPKDAAAILQVREKKEH